MDKPIEIPNIRNITVSGRIASGASTLAHKLGGALNWEVLDGGKYFRKISNIQKSDSRPDEIDLEYEERIKKMLREKSGQIIQSHLAGFDAQGIPGVFKILVECVSHHGEDKLDIRIDRLVNRDAVSVEKAKEEILSREAEHLKKFRRLYAKNDENWAYWDPKYYDLVVNTYDHNPDESLKLVLNSINSYH